MCHAVPVEMQNANIKTGVRGPIGYEIALGLLALALIPPISSVGQQTPATDAGLLWVQFNSPDFTRPRDMGEAKQVSIDTGATFNDYSQVWLGLIEFPTNQPVTFSAEADDGLRLFLDEKPVICGWGMSADRKGSFRCKAGERVSLRLDHYQQGGVGYLRLYWHWKGHPRELVPASAFSHTPAQKEEIQAMHDGKLPQHEDPSIIYQPDNEIPGRAQQADLPVPAQPGPHLLLDDYLIAESLNLDRVVMQPQRDPSIPNPIVTGPGDGCIQPFLTVLRDPKTGRFRIWYGARRDDRNVARTHLATMKSDDGIHFTRPPHICDTPELQFSSSVIDRGPNHDDPATRYVYAYWLGGGTRLLTSADGLKWRSLIDGIVLPHNHDITGLNWDPVRETYAAIVSTLTTGSKWTGERRTTMMSYSKDLRRWGRPWFVLTASSELDEGLTQFYAMDGFLTRGPLRIAMVKILRDDLRATNTQPGSFGRAHTSLVWSRDGRTWVRDRAMFFEPDDDPRAWDHAHAWIDEQLIVGDKVYLYYCGYKQGHKMNRFEERQIGLVRMPLDRYVARRANTSTAGRLKTVPIRLGKTPGTLHVNAAATGGQLRVQVRDAQSDKVLPGLSFADCQAITTDGLRLPVRWHGGGLSRASGRTVRLEFEVSRASLFAFEFVRQSKRH